MTGAERRATLLDAHEELIAGLALAGRSLDEQPDDPDFLALEDELFWSAERVRREYSDLLNPIAISRCPFTNEVFRASIDTHDIDGLWWNYLSPLRRSDPRPTTLVALTGALALSTAPTWTPFLVKPGPGVPYVIPRLLAADEVAVVSVVPVGPHRGYAICYFSADRPGPDVARANDWGASEYPVIDEAGDSGWGSVVEDESALDFDLVPWLTSAKLRWIAPGDASLTIRSGAQGCPFVGLVGPRIFQRIEEGSVR